MNSQPRSQGFWREWFCFYKSFYPFTWPMFFYTCFGNVKKCIKIKIIKTFKLQVSLKKQMSNVKMKTLYWCMILNVIYTNRMFFMFRMHKWKILLLVCWIVWLNKAGNKVKLQTFKSWNFEEFGFKILKENGILYVNYVWCKICAKNKECIKQDPSVKSASKNVADVFIDGTN